MRYGQIRRYDIANGEGIRTSIFVTGCTHGCFNCFNEEYQDFSAGKLWTEKETQQVIDYLKDDNIAGLTLLGGEPFQNTEDLLKIVRDIRKESSKSIWVYSGYTWSELLKNPLNKALLKECQVLVDGRYVESLKDLALRFRGSSNQRVIDIEKSFETGELVLYLE